MKTQKMKRSRWPIYLSGILVFGGLYLLASESLNEILVFNLPLDKLGGIAFALGILFFCVWYVVDLLKSFVLVVRNYKIIPKLFKQNRDIQKIEDESKIILEEALRIEKLAQEHEPSEKTHNNRMQPDAAKLRR